MDAALAYLEREHPGEAARAAWARGVLIGAGHGLEERVYRGWQGLGYHHDVAGYLGGIFPRPGEVGVFFEHGARLLGDHAGRGLVARGTRGAVLPVVTCGPEEADALRAVLDHAVQLGLARSAERR